MPGPIAPARPPGPAVRPAAGNCPVPGRRPTPAVPGAAQAQAQPVPSARNARRRPVPGNARSKRGAKWRNNIIMPGARPIMPGGNSGWRLTI